MFIIDLCIVCGQPVIGNDGIRVEQSGTAPKYNADESKRHRGATDPIECRKMLLQEDRGADNTKEKHACIIEGKEQGSIHAVVDQRSEENDCRRGTK